MSAVHAVITSGFCFRGLNRLLAETLKIPMTNKCWIVNEFHFWSILCYGSIRFSPISVERKTNRKQQMQPRPMRKTNSPVMIHENFTWNSTLETARKAHECASEKPQTTHNSTGIIVERPVHSTTFHESHSYSSLFPNLACIRRDEAIGNSVSNNYHFSLNVP